MMSEAMVRKEMRDASGAGPACVKLQETFNTFKLETVKMDPQYSMDRP